MSEGTTTFQLNKLVRDRIPDLDRAMGETPEVRYLERGEHIRALVDKMLEELGELSGASETYHKELADVKQTLMDLVDLSVGEGAIEETQALYHSGLSSDELVSYMTELFVSLKYAGDQIEYPQMLVDADRALKELIELSDAANLVEQLRLKDLKERGGFRDGAYITRLTLQPGDPWADYYRREPDRFLEIKGE